MQYFYYLILLSVINIIPKLHYNINNLKNCRETFENYQLKAAPEKHHCGTYLMKD
jgi:hypothetical protein